jgi:uncharacterized membrane-anchored protein
MIDTLGPGYAMGRAFPADDPQRRVLHEEVHARPPARIVTPERVAHLAVRIPAEARDAEARSIAELARFLGVATPKAEASFAWLEGNALRVKWERHTEFTSLTFFRRVTPDAPVDTGALDLLPREWLAALPGATIVAARVDIRRASPEEVAQAIAGFGDTTVVGSTIGDGAASVLTDFRIGDDGCSRFLVLDHSLGERQAGRYVQRLLEIETYRMMALLAYPVAREVGATLTDAETRLARITERMIDVAPREEPQLLDDLTRLAAEVERGESASRFRFGAAAAYYRLVRQRIGELRESRLPRVQTIAEFMDRRLAPAMATCESVASRQDELSARVARASQLLRTRVDITLERQNQDLLASMDRRAKVQLRLQQTVEGLSVAAITYYAAGLVGYLAKAGKSLGLPLDPDVAVGVAIPLIALALWRGLRRLRRSLGHE